MIKSSLYIYIYIHIYICINMLPREHVKSLGVGVVIISGELLLLGAGDE